VFLYLKRTGPAVLHGVAEAVQGANTGVPTPGEDQFLGAAHPDHLVVDEVRGHPDQGQVPPLLADDLVASGGRNEVREAFEGDRVAVVDQFGYCLAQGRHFAQLLASFPGAVPHKISLVTTASSFKTWPMPGQT
jgi:hypothetical protein